MRVKVIGIGGIGGCVLPVLCKFLSFKLPQEERAELVLVDGDRYEDNNEERQFFERLGNKAEVSVERLKSQFPRVTFDSIPSYVDESNIDTIIREKDIVFLCVDNHPTRKLVSERCEELKNIVLISGGNELTDGNIQVHVRDRGKNITPPITNARHTEIAEADGKLPSEMGCEELAQQSQPQLVIMNNMIAAMMLGCFYTYLQGSLSYMEAYSDIVTGNSRAVQIEQELLVEI